jgi:di/tricarboxylate transporter
MIGGATAIAIILALGLAAFASGRLRHDLVAILMLLAAVAFGVVAPSAAFSGFGDPVVVTVAAIMILSAAVANSGVVRLALTPLRPVLISEIGIAAAVSLLCAIASAFMNNIGALALLMPAALSACRTAEVSPSRVLMPMAFASLLGGLTTLIGTPPNVIISELRTEYVGTRFHMFDFLPVGGSLALIGLLTMILTLRAIPRRVAGGDRPLQFQVSDYLFEVRVLEQARETPLTVADLETPIDDDETLAVRALDRGGIIFAAPGGWRPLHPGDIVQLEGRAPLVQNALERHGLEIVSGSEDDALEAALFECVVPQGSPLTLGLPARQQLSDTGAALLAVSRSGRAIVDRLERIQLAGGDVVLLQAPERIKADIVERFALLPLADRQLDLSPFSADWRAALALGGAIGASALGLAPLALALLAAIAALALMGRLTGRAYRDVDWSIILLLAALIPVAQAFADQGAGDAVARWLSSLSTAWPAPVIIGVVLAATMLATPFLNNAAAVLIMAPIAAEVGRASDVSIDAMLMAVAIGASSDFLTPIGHQSNTLVMGPGGYRFFDYPRLGAPLSLVVLVLGTVLISAIWT